MTGFSIQNLTATPTYGYYIGSYLPEKSFFNRGIINNVSLYCPEDLSAPIDSKNKLVNLMDGDTREGFLNFYMLRFDNDEVHAFIFGNFHGMNIQKTFFVGNDYSGHATKELTKKFNKLVQEQLEDFQRGYFARNINIINNSIGLIQDNLK